MKGSGWNRDGVWKVGLAVAAASLVGRAVLYRAADGPVFQGKSVGAWAKQLGDRSSVRRQEAAIALRFVGPAATPAVPDLTRALSDESPWVRANAADALEAIGPAAVAAVPDLVRLLGDRVAGESAAYALAAVGPEAVPALREAISTNDLDVLDHVCLALGEMGLAARPAVPDLIALLKDEDRRGMAAEALGHLGPVAVPTLIEALAHADANVRFGAVEALGNAKAHAGPAVPNLIEALRPGGGAPPANDPEGEDERARWRGRVVWALGNIGPAARAAVPALVRVLTREHDGDDVLRGAAAYALGEIGPSAGEAVPALLDLMREKEAALRVAAPYALGRVGPAAKPAVAPLLHGLKDGDPWFRVRCAEALWRIDRRADAAVPVLTAALGPRPDRAPATPEEIAAEVVWYPARDEAIDALGRIGPPARQAVPALLAALEDKEGHVRAKAAAALWEVDGNAGATVPVLIALLLDDEEVRDHAWWETVPDTLGRMGSAAAPAVPALVELLRDPRAVVRGDVAAALKKIDPKAADEHGLR